MTMVGVLCDSLDEFLRYTSEMSANKRNSYRLINTQKRARLYNIDAIMILHPLPHDYEAILEVLIEHWSRRKLGGDSR